MPIKKTAYPAWFNDLWSQHLTLKTKIAGAPNKHLAYQWCKRHKIDESDVDYLIQCFKNHTDHIRSMRSQNLWVQEHQDFERWLKNKTWENWENPVEVVKQSASDRLGDRSWSEAYRPYVREETAPSASEAVRKHMEGIKKLLG